MGQCIYFPSTKTTVAKQHFGTKIIERRPQTENLAYLNDFLIINLVQGKLAQNRKNGYSLGNFAAYGSGREKNRKVIISGPR